MSARRVWRTRPAVWHNSATRISTAVFSASTDDAWASVHTLPMPTINLVFGGDAHGGLSLIRPEPARSIAGLSPASPSSAAPGAAYHPLDRDDPRPLGRNDPHPLGRDDPHPLGRDDPVPPHPHRIELSIDSLANHLLVEPIPVAIDPVGDDAYTAWVHNLDTNVTGNSVVEALLLLKERIEFVYEDLSGREDLSAEEQLTLQIMHTYIAPKKPEWA